MEDSAAYQRNGSFGTGLAKIATTGILIASLMPITTGCSSSQEDDNIPVQSAQQEDATDDDPSSQEVSSEQNSGLGLEVVPDGSRITAQELFNLLNTSNPPTVIDIRTAGQYGRGYIEGSKSLPAGRQFDLRIDEIPQDETIVLISEGNSRLGEAYQTLLDAGFDPDSILIVEDGLEAWISAGYPLGEKGEHAC